MMQAVGHVDFYPNGGKDQPGCNADPVTQILIQGGIYDGYLNYSKSFIEILKGGPSGYILSLFVI